MTQAAGISAQGQLLDPRAAKQCLLPNSPMPVALKQGTQNDHISSLRATS